jgi:hypothetical protein
MSLPTMKKLQMRTLRWILVAAVAVLVSCGDGSSLTTSDASSTTSEASSTSTVTEIEVVYKVGDTGPGGGIIVYVDEAGFDNSSGYITAIGAMCLAGACHYLEMAPTDLNGLFSWDEASVAAEAFSTSSANDWLLPSRDALNEMCKYAVDDTVNVICNDGGEGNLTLRFGSFSERAYICFSLADDPNLFWQDIPWGFQMGDSKYDTDYKLAVRPVRAF